MGLLFLFSAEQKNVVLVQSELLGLKITVEKKVGVGRGYNFKIAALQLGH
jgi:hypothetical protein